MRDCTEVAWAAGFFDGEGSTVADMAKRQGRVRISIAQVNRDVLERFAAATGDDRVRIYGPYQRAAGRPYYELRSCSRDGANHVLSAMWPFMSNEKKRQAIKAFEAADAVG